MSFYPNVKPHISPSAFANWFNARGSFVKSYFLGIKFIETASTKAGKQIHALIEGGFLAVKHRYENAESKLIVALFDDPERFELIKTDAEGEYTLPEGSIGAVLGLPDSYGLLQGSVAAFVDYKSGKANTWDGVKLAGDLKMKLTSWLVWNHCGKPSAIHGFIEYIPTEWNEETRQIEQTGGESQEVASCVYTGEEMQAMTEVIRATMLEINAAYEEWLNSTDEFVNQEDVAEYTDLDQKKRDIETRMGIIKERIAEQMAFGKKDALNTPGGTFYTTRTRKWSFPPTLKVNYLDMGIVLEDAEAIAAATAAAKKKFETENPPVSETTSIGFRAAKTK